MNVDLSKLRVVGENVLAGMVQLDGMTSEMLVLVINPEEEQGLSSTGKMVTIASSGGFTRLPGGLSANIYVGRKAK